jgi:hypothetical protein
VLDKTPTRPARANLARLRTVAYRMLGTPSEAAFLAASREGNFDALLALLDPDVLLRADEAAVAAGATREVRGGPAVAETFKGRARVARPALVNGAVGAVWAPGGQPRVVVRFTIAKGKVVAPRVARRPCDSRSARFSCAERLT